MVEHVREHSLIGQPDHGRIRPLKREEIYRVLDRMTEGLPKAGRILLVPPDITRLYSYAGVITSYLYKKLSVDALVRILPVTGTHRPMTPGERCRFFGRDIPDHAFLIHDWCRDTVDIGTVPGAYCAQVSAGRYTGDICAQVNHYIVDQSFDLILSIGQVVPHEVTGMSNYTKNILVGLGGRRIINESHMLGAVCNLETIMGNTDTPVRAVFDYIEEHFLKQAPLMYILTVTSQAKEDRLVHGIFTGASRQVFEHAAALARECNITYLPKAVEKVVAYLEPEEFSSFWVGNKAVYRTRMIIRDGGELLVIAPGLKDFGENPEVDRLIRRYGYKGTERTMELVREGEFADMTMVPAHMIHSSSEGRFKITYAVDPGKLSPQEVQAAGYGYMDVSEALKRYPVACMEDGMQRMEDGEEIYVVKSPALGVWKVGGTPLRNSNAAFRKTSTNSQGIVT